MYILFDCNNFFASCEQIFRPDWRRRPLIVLSNNDGCIISRSAEAKALGYAMGEPYFKCKQRIQHTQTVVCSSNFALYGNISDRIMGILEESLPQTEHSSVDEAFAYVSKNSPIEWEKEAAQLRRRIRRWTGITVSVGLAPTKTLAKLANERAKKDPSGLLSLQSPEHWEEILRQTPVGDIWGVGKQLQRGMRALGISTAQQLAQASLERLRRSFGVQGERIALELNGTDCNPTHMPKTRGQIMVSRSLKSGLIDKAQLRGLLCRFAEKAAITLRKEELLTGHIHIHLRSSLYDNQGNIFNKQHNIALEHPTEDTREISNHATALLDQIWQEGIAYKKVGIILTNLSKRKDLHPSFARPNVGPSKLMQTLDTLQQQGINIHFGNYSAEEHAEKSFVSPRYTTEWGDIPEAR